MALPKSQKAPESVSEPAALGPVGEIAAHLVSPTDGEPASWSLGEDSLATAGIRANRKRGFHIALTGEQLYWLLAGLERVALRSESYPEVRNCVCFAERIRAQAKAQGF